MNDEVNDNRQKEPSSEVIRAKILHLLRIYPIISPTMLQSGLGAYIRPGSWRPILAELLEAGKVVEDQESRQTPADRYNTYSKLMLPGTVVELAVKDLANEGE